ncbi:SRPBCC family protein [Roseibium sp. SCP14]|uniref:SRPBCC family protein n=1 Tax=Roseibium sp. SCP14 TaxID=3141375 RepID=UPI0033371888
MKKADIVVSQVVAAPLEKVWESWADFGGIYKFHKGVARTTILKDSAPRGIGAVRLCELSDGKNEIEEQVVEWIPLQKIGIEFKRTSLPIARARADFLFDTCSDDRVCVEMQFSFEPRGCFMRIAKPVLSWKMRQGFQKLLKSNKDYLELS